MKFDYRDENSRNAESSTKMSDEKTAVVFGKIEKVSDAVTKSVKTWTVPSVRGSKKDNALAVQLTQEGIHEPDNLVQITALSKTVD